LYSSSAISDRAVLVEKGRSRPCACNHPANIGTRQSLAKTARHQLGTARHRDADHHRNRKAENDGGQQSFDHRILLSAERDLKSRGSAAWPLQADPQNPRSSISGRQKPP
jgi:hypothetical protein